ncbi:electron transport protein SCO1/SenC [Opitutus terrae PB90-1]|uniref:Electron transport protein SCO1/SenC n=2 Tax=Opitutus terrae TaxID=107709 RepID=B1ZWX4_OPITP|nr:electron transport protein SCO1/SenC [Opitutus terrae PB90-1]
MRRMRALRFLALFALVFADGWAAETARAATEQVFTVRGVVRGRLQNGTLRIAHQAIPDYMPAMTMPFNVDPAALEQAAQFQPGDGVEFKFAVTDASSRAFDFRRIGGPRGADEPAAIAAVPARRLREGDEVPPFVLRDQLDRPLTLADLRGKRTVLTFIFTRCPVPEFCPLMSQRFRTLQQALATSPSADTPVQLLSITLDPEFDTPQILRAYGESYGADPARWRFATGPKEQITALTRAFAVHTEQSRGTLDHTLATALIGPDARVQTIWRGNGWKPDEILAALAQPPSQ